MRRIQLLQHVPAVVHPRGKRVFLYELIVTADDAEIQVHVQRPQQPCLPSDVCALYPATTVTRSTGSFSLTGLSEGSRSREGTDSLTLIAAQSRTVMVEAIDV